VTRGRSSSRVCRPRSARAARSSLTTRPSSAADSPRWQSGDARLEAWVASLDERIVDLLEPFRGLAYYHPAQLGSASLKAVLPILGNRGYDHLEIQDGAFAGREFLRSIRPETPEAERARIRSALLQYCGRDTEGMVEIVRALEQLVR
jgi:hypothetical protein